MNKGPVRGPNGNGNSVNVSTKLQYQLVKLPDTSAVSQKGGKSRQSPRGYSIGGDDDGSVRTKQFL